MNEDLGNTVIYLFTKKSRAQWPRV